jgi:hypothetical protein
MIQNSVNLPAAITAIMNLQERIKSLSALGEILRDCLDTRSGHGCEELDKLINNQYKTNPWFTAENVRMALRAIAEELTRDNLTRWTNQYPDLLKEVRPLKTGIIMAGNIPLVGFHDFLSVLITGNHLIAKTSSKDNELIRFISDILCFINPSFTEKIKFTEGTLENFDVIIATGSDNSSRYFEYYFGKYPNIIRRNRNSIAVLKGDESDEELEKLGIDIFSYFGLGCRNVSKLLLPDGYDIESLYPCWESFSKIISHPKYANNYDFNKAVYIVNKEPFSDSGFILLKEENKIASPVSVLYYSYYDSQYALEQETELHRERIQCIVGKDHIPFGQAQSPHLWDYADGIDTVDFLLKKNIAGIL